MIPVSTGREFQKKICLNPCQTKTDLQLVEAELLLTSQATITLGLEGKEAECFIRKMDSNGRL